MGSKPKGRLTVLGAGVIGLTTAILLSDHYDVTILAENVGAETNSRMATAVWHVYLVTEAEMEADDPHLFWAERTLLRLLDLARTAPESGLEIIGGIELFRKPAPSIEQCWVPVARSHLGLRMLNQSEIDKFNDYSSLGVDTPERAALEENPVIWGYALRAPAVSMPTYLRWLEASAAGKGVTFTRKTISAITDIVDPGLCVVNCCGFAARELVGDVDFVPYKGQYFVLSSDRGSPTYYVGDDDHPAGMAYAIPRSGEVVVGGTAERDCESPSPDIEWSDIKARAGLYLPWVAEHTGAVGEPIVGIRPVRRTGVRLERDDTLAAYQVIHNYGHGGSGFSLSWGCAERVRALVSQLHDGTGA